MMTIFNRASKTWLLILSSFLAGWILMFMQLPSWMDAFRPPWLVLILFFWVLIKPEYVNVGVAWLVGFILDLLFQVPLGENALILVLVTYLISKFQAKILLVGFYAQSLIIFCIILLYQLFRFFMQIYFGGYFNPWSILNSAIISGIVWPFMAIFMFNCQRKIRY